MGGMTLPKMKKSLILVAVVLLIFSFILPVFANQIEDKKNELGNVRDDLKQRKQELQQNKEEQDKVSREIDHLEAEIKVIEAEIRLLAKKITETEKQIAETEAELEVAEDNVEHMDSVLAVRLRTIYENGKVSYLDVLFSSSSFVEFLTRFNNLQLIINQDKVMLEEFKVEKERIEAIKESLEERRQELQTLRRKNVQKKEQAVKKRAEQEKLMAALQDVHNEVEKAVRQLEAEARELDNLIKQLQAAQRGTTGYRGTGTMTWPVPEYGPSWITSPYGYRTNPFTGAPGAWHGGVDIGIPRVRWPRASNYNGSPVQVVAVDTGIAYVYPLLGGYGNLVVVDHGGGIATAYAHLDSFLVGHNTPVVRGQAIGIVGSTGASTGPHLHFEVRVNGSRVDPMPYIR
jgi:murein DD-endopeptidase MepM/ murein hydrolase activator NlpD